MELLGTELEPDWHVWEGSYDSRSLRQGPGRRQDPHAPGPSPDESARAARSAVAPAKRFHIAIRGADLARSAASLLADGTDEKARILATAGTWLKGRDPAAAQPFYQAVLSCCGATEIGRKAKRFKAVPTVDACENDQSRRPRTRIDEPKRRTPRPFAFICRRRPAGDAGAGALVTAGFGAGMLLGNDFLGSLARSLFGAGSGAARRW